MKQRLDLLLVERGLAASRRAAQALVMSGRVRVDGRLHDKPGARIDPLAELSAEQPATTFVGRGGTKLAGALDAFGIDPSGLTALDVGASTGGFTDCLLQRGATRVFSVDVGRGQIDWKLRNDPRVVLVEGVNARYLTTGDLPGIGPGADLAAVDVSFISLKLVLPRIPPVLRPPPAVAPLIVLVKPQFEVGRRRVSRGGIVRDPEVRREALADVARFSLGIGLGVRALARSPITGAEGNVEYFLHLVTGGGALDPERIDEEAARVVGEEPAHA